MVTALRAGPSSHSHQLELEEKAVVPINNIDTLQDAVRTLPLGQSDGILDAWCQFSRAMFRSYHSSSMRCLSASGGWLHL